MVIDMTISAATRLIVTIALASLVVAGCGSDNTTAAPPDSSTSALRANTTTTTTTTQAAAADSGPTITVDNVCSFVDPAAAQTATGVAAMTTSSSVLADYGTISCKFAAPGAAETDYGTVMFLALTDSAPSNAPFHGLPGGKVTDPDPAGAQYATTGRYQTIVEWDYHGHVVRVSGRGPSVTDDSMLALAKAIDSKLHG